MSSALHDAEFINKVRFEFSAIKNIHELSNLLNFIDSQLSDNSNKKRISAKSLHYLRSTKDKRYKTISIPKKNGKNRIISAPDTPLKRVQKLLNRLLQIIFQNHEHYNSNGFLPQRGIVRNAQAHVNKRYLLNLDIKDFFPSITFRRIKSVLSLNPFNLKDEKENIAFFIANLCTLNGKLPQGAPTSPILSNIVTQRLDRRITKFCNINKIRYSRYADDLSFSSNKNIFNKELNSKLIEIIEAENFIVNSDKTRLQSNGERQEVTGIIVNKKLNVNRNYLKKIRAILYNWENKGQIYTEDKFLLHYNKPDKGEIDFRNVLWGYINFVGLVRGQNDRIYQDYFYKYLLLKNKIDFSFVTHENVKIRLDEDNAKMEQLYCKCLLTKEDKFIDFCTNAFYQIENLLYYFYWRRFPNIRDLSEYLYENNPSVKAKARKGVHYYGKIGDIQINHLVYLFEKEFYFDRGRSYNQELTFIRDARNDNLHRCALNKLDVEEIKKGYHKIQEYDKRYFLQHGRNRPDDNKSEMKIKQNYRFIQFMEKHDYNDVRSRLVQVVEQIRTFPDTIGLL